MASRRLEANFYGLGLGLGLGTYGLGLGLGTCGLGLGLEGPGLGFESCINNLTCNANATIRCNYTSCESKYNFKKHLHSTIRSEDTEVL